MGGRGSKFIIEQPKENKNIYLGDYNKDTETTKQNGLTRKLREYNIIVCKSTDTIEEKLLYSNLKQIESLSKTYDILSKGQPELHIRNYNIRDDEIIACYARVEPDMTQSQICYNKKCIFDIEEMDKKISKMMNTGFSAKAENKIDYVITHEFGHYLERNIIEKRLQQDIRQYAKFKNLNSEKALKIIAEESDKIYTEIDKIAREKYNNSELGVSKYSLQKNSQEWFAEVFASAYTNKLHKLPLAKAMIDFLKKEIKSYVD